MGLIPLSCVFKDVLHRVITIKRDLSHEKRLKIDPVMSRLICVIGGGASFDTNQENHDIHMDP